MPKNVMKLLKRVPNHARNAFDMSHRHLVTANFGELLPITCIETIPGDYVELSVSDLLRAAPMVTSPFLRAKQHIDVYYVPYHDLWSKFEQFYTKRDEPKSAGERQSLYVPHITDYGLKTLGLNSDGSSDVLGRERYIGAAKLLDLLGYGRVDLSSFHSNRPSVNLWRLMAYNKIWYEHYRQQYYDDGSLGLSSSDFVDGVINPAVLFNADDLRCNTAQYSNFYPGSGDTSVYVNPSNVMVGGSEPNRIGSMCQMRYRLWKKDLFTGLVPSTQFGQVSAVFVNGNSISGLVSKFRLEAVDTWTSNRELLVSANNRRIQASSAASTLTPASNPTYFFFNAKDVNGNGASMVSSSSSDSSSFNFDVLSLRKSEALQIWREAALTAGNRISDNLKAHLGDDAEYNNHESRLIGSISSSLNISDVNSTSQVGDGVNQSLGDVAGKGISTIDQNVIKFKAKDFGVIMVLFSMLPEAEYQSDGIDRMNMLLEQEDYFNSEYQDLGLEPVSSEEFYVTPTNVQKVIGYAPRYVGYKQKIDKCFNGFKNTQGANQFAPWASPKTDVTAALAGGAASLPLSVLYVNPSLFDRNFVAGVDVSEQFLCDFFFDCTKVSQMSVSGLPRM